MGHFLPPLSLPLYIWQFLRAFQIATAVGVSECYWDSIVVEGKDATEQLTMSRKAPQQRIIWPKCPYCRCWKALV